MAELLPADVAELLPYLSDGERRELDVLLSGLPIWLPVPGPQTAAYLSQADIIGFGGAAGGGKTDLACGKALTQHQKVLILRRDAKQLQGIVDRLRELVGNDDGFNSQKGVWRLDGLQIELGSCLHLNDWQKYQGRPHDLLVFDEAANFLEAQVRALLGWLRSTDPQQKCQALLTFNPPTTDAGLWIFLRRGWIGSFPIRHRREKSAMWQAWTARMCGWMMTVSLCCRTVRRCMRLTAVRCGRRRL